MYMMLILVAVFYLDNKLVKYTVRLKGIDTLKLDQKL